ncbi:MAG: heavy metal-binding domain-containing protein [Maricaulaceae bacterium]
MMSFLLSVGWPILLLLIGWMFGRIKIRNHRTRLDRFETDLKQIRLHNVKYKGTNNDANMTAHMLNASLVLSIDVFQRFLATLTQLTGGEHCNYTDLLDRGRRDALIRLKTQAKNLGANDIYNIKIQSASIGAGKGIEILAYGTAIKST